MFQIIKIGRIIKALSWKCEELQSCKCRHLPFCVKHTPVFPIAWCLSSPWSRPCVCLGHQAGANLENLKAQHVFVIFPLLALCEISISSEECVRRRVKRSGFCPLGKEGSFRRRVTTSFRAIPGSAQWPGGRQGVKQQDRGVLRITMSSFCRITGKARDQPKPNFFPIIPPISPADARWILWDAVKKGGGRFLGSSYRSQRFCC